MIEGGNFFLRHSFDLGVGMPTLPSLLQGLAVVSGSGGGTGSGFGCGTGSGFEGTQAASASKGNRIKWFIRMDSLMANRRALG